MLVSRAYTSGVTERITLLLSAHVEIAKNPEWLLDEALRSGVVFSVGRLHTMTQIQNFLISIFRKDHPANYLFKNSRSLSPGTTNYIAMKQSKIDRSAYSKEKADTFVKPSEVCRSQGDKVANFLRYYYL